MNSPATQQILAVDQEGFGVAVVFAEQAGHFAHAVLAVTPERRWVMLQSKEYDSDGEELSHWPPSPPLQQLSIESRPHDEQVALLVGMAGKSHWSMSVETARRQRRVVLDIACRTPTAPQWLGSSYHVLGAATIEPQAWRPPPAAPQFGGPRGVSLVLRADLLLGSASQSASTWIVEPPLLPTSPPATTMWRFALQLELAE